MTEYGRFNYESYQDLQTIQKFFELLRSSFENGKITLSSGTDEIVLEPKDLLRFKLKAKKKESLSKLEITISWKEGEIEPTAEKLKVGPASDV
jgi:amphi-Trp domain-containing protein